MKIRDKNPISKGIIEHLHKKALETKTPFWDALADGLNRPRRKSFEVNLYNIERYAKAKETVVVPGIVLGTGDITKPVTVAALRFSEEARKKIAKSGGKCMAIEELVAAGKAKDVRIMG